MKLVLSVLLVVFALTSEAKRNNDYNRDNGRNSRQDYRRDNRDGRNNQNQNEEYQGDNSQNQNGQRKAPADDSALVNAVQNQKQVMYLQAASMTVVRVLPDDNQGLTHQKFIVKLSSGKMVVAVYNTDMCERVPVKVGDVVGLGGNFIWTNQGGLIHWLHKDPSNRRPDGYVELNGKKYCFQ